MIVATWNVNSVRVRLDQICAWLDLATPDVLCLQETKCPDGAFPRQAFEELGYHCTLHGEKRRNGVAVLSLGEPERVERGLGDGQARLLEVRYRNLRIINVYAPAGGMSLSDPKFAHKMLWYDLLMEHVGPSDASKGSTLVMGDFNIVPEDRDARHPEAWRETPVAHPKVRAFHDALLDRGFVDLVRHHHDNVAALYTWWGYQSAMFARDDGLRIDHIYASRDLALCSDYVHIDREERAHARPSDHAPVVASFAGV